MPNHAHLLITPAHAGDLGRAMQCLGRRYVRWFNDRHRRVGALFEGRYRSSVVDADRYLLACMRYVELNPVRAKLCERPADFRWSSHRHHVGLAVDPLVTDHQIYWGLGNTPFERQAAYLGLFERGPGSEELDRIRKSAHGGWLLASPEVAAQIERTVVRPTTERRAGRPRKGP
jgi:putative transposase